jgi:hypothetical protein
MEPFTFSQYSFTPNDNDLLDLTNPSEKNSPLTSTSPGLSMQRSMPFQVKKEPLIAKSDDINNSLSPMSPMMILHGTSNPSPTTPPQHFGILMPQAIPAPMAQRLRRVIYNIQGVFSLVIQMHHCNTHNNLFDEISPQVVSQLSEKYTPSLGFFISPRILFTTRLARYIFNAMPLVGFNFARIKKLLMLNWSGGYDSLSTWSIKNMYIAYWRNIAQQKYDNRVEQLQSSTGQVLRGDHTYKIVKNLSAFSDFENKRVCYIKVWYLSLIQLR